MANASTAFDIKRIDPPDWWVGMKDTSLQLCVYGKNISAWEVSINYPGVKVLKVNKVENPNYLFVDLSLSPKTKAGNADIVFTSGKQKNKYPASIQELTKKTYFRVGLF